MINFDENDRSLRKGKIETAHGDLNFPVFMPDATYGTISNMSFKDLEETGINAIVTNTLHLEQKLGSEKIAKLGGFHKLTGWDKPVLTDSGGFQVFSLIARRPNVKNKITDAGCSFVDYESGQYKFLSPETSQQIQAKIGSDIRVVLDEPVLENASLTDIKRSVERTTDWAKRSKKMFLELNNLSEDDFNNPKVKRPLLTAVVQGGSNFEYRKISLEALVEVGFDIYGLGGLPLQLKRTWDYSHEGGFYKELLQFLAESMPKDKLRYALGVGTPDNLRFAISVGWDLFDTVLPTRNARHGYIYVNNEIGDKEYDNYSVLHLSNTRYEYDESPLDSSCGCHTCKTTSRAYLRYLLKIGEGSGYRLASIHNLHFYSQFMEKIVRENKNV
ncbi:MAG TPA: tRNA guanosine(34) transglycosylase Tgt [Candidatus Dojkabacteria bacterium]|nr:tRNA guanosine(34) transglycosylase Tgt [Candidatus Dojkabacteria bacterium]HRP51744.1 tRNA guanosine(34) transglycosylase Tgt [Candidatus Dojkabacteria bacterium]